MEPRKIVEAYFQAVNEGRFADAAGYFAADLRLWLVGEGSWKLGGLHDRNFMLGIQKLMLERFPEGVQVALRHVMAEGDEVMAEVETTGLRRDGRKYHNRYAQIFVVRDDKIVERREYFDTIHANELFCGPLNPA
jgi:ketosteroid isomerase-like protein